MTQSFRLPDLGEGVHEAEILSIRVKPDQTVQEGEVIFEIETDKAAVEIPSPFTGKVVAIPVSEGDLARVGDILITFALEKEQKKTASPQKTTAPGEARETATATKRPVPAAPSTRRLARELGVDLHLIDPTGPGGVVTREDVESFADQPQDEVPTQPDRTTSGETEVDDHPPEIPPREPSPLPDFSQWGPVQRVPFRSIRRATAKRMIASWSLIPHVHCMDDADITKLESFRQKHKEEIEEAGGRLTMTVFAVKAVATALKTYPAFNASLDMDSQEIIIKQYFHIGIAVDSDKGLMVPVVRDVDRKSIKELAGEIHQAIARVRKGEHQPSELQGGTFTISNAGALGGHRFSAIINHPEVAILGLGQGRLQPVVVSNKRGINEIVPRLIMPLTLCFDHRVVDGGDAIRFLRLVISALEDPEELLMTMI